MHEAFLVNDKFYIFQDLICGGDLFSYLCRGGLIQRTPENEVIILIFQLLKALEYLHSRNIMHRDLKLDNILLAAPVACTRILLCDFGVAKHLLHAESSTQVGTVEYAAPELFQSKSYGLKADMWSLGIVCHILVSLISPFFAGQLNLNIPEFDSVSHNSKNFILNLLQEDPRNRMNIGQCFQHPWILNNRAVLDKIYQKILEV